MDENPYKSPQGRQAGGTPTTGPIPRVLSYALLGLGMLWCVGVLISAGVVLVFDSANVSKGWAKIVMVIGFEIAPGVAGIVMGTICLRRRK